MTTISQEMITLAQKEGQAIAPTVDRDLPSLIKAVQKYFDLMYDCDTLRFDEVFQSTVHLHGFRDGGFVAWPGQTYKDILDRRQSPKSCGAKRADEILLIDLTSSDMAFVKVRVRIAEMVFVDYLTWHKIGGKWRITSKGFHLQSVGRRTKPLRHMTGAKT